MLWGFGQIIGLKVETMKENYFLSIEKLRSLFPSEDDLGLVDIFKIIPSLFGSGKRTPEPLLKLYPVRVFSFYSKNESYKNTDSLN